VRRLGLSPYVVGFDDAVRGGVPIGSWSSFFGPPGAYKTLHALAFCLAGADRGEPCVYVSTEMTYREIRQQLESLGWDTPLAKLGRSVSGEPSVLVVDPTSLDYVAATANRVLREKRERLHAFDAPTIVMSVVSALEALGVVERVNRELSASEVLYSRLSSRTHYTFVEGGPVRVVIDSISPLIMGKYAVAGRIIGELKRRLYYDNITYVLVSHAAKATEEELGASIGYLTDVRVKLWFDLYFKYREAKYYGWIVKARYTDHSRRLHEIKIEDDSGSKVLVWSEPR